MCQQILGKFFNVILHGSHSSGSRLIIRRQTGTGVGNERRAECKSRVFVTLCFESAEMSTTTFIIRKYWVRNVTRILNIPSLIYWFLYEGYMAFAAKQMKGKAGHICVRTISELKVQSCPPYCELCAKSNSLPELIFSLEIS
jgi:hypothetical protein